VLGVHGRRRVHVHVHVMPSIVSLLFAVSWYRMNSWLVVEAEHWDVVVGAYVFFLLLQVALVVVLFRDSRASASQHRVSCTASQQAAQQFRFGINLSSSLTTPPVAPPSIPDEEPSPPPQATHIDCARVKSDVADAPNVTGNYRRRARLWTHMEAIVSRSWCST